MSAVSKMIPCELPTFVIVFVIRNTMFYERAIVNSEASQKYKEEVKALIA